MSATAGGVPGRVIRAEAGTFAEMVAAVGRAGRAFVALVRSLDVTEAAQPVPGMDWTVAQTAAHLIGITMRGTGDRRRAATIQELGALNLLQVEEIGESDPSALADLLEQRLEGQLSRLGAASGDEPFELHAGLYADVKTALSYELWDFLLHGFDIAAATGRRWSIEPADAALDVMVVLPALEPWVRDDVRSGRSRELSFALAPEGRAVAVAVGAGTYGVRLVPAGSAPVVDPVELLLALSKRRSSSDRVVAELSSWFLPT